MNIGWKLDTCSYMEHFMKQAFLNIWKKNALRHWNEKDKTREIMENTCHGHPSSSSYYYSSSSEEPNINERMMSCFCRKEWPHLSTGSSQKGLAVSQSKRGSAQAGKLSNFVLTLLVPRFIHAPMCSLLNQKKVQNKTLTQNIPMPSKNR